MSKGSFKRVVAQKSAELRKWANEHNVTFKTTSEIEREKERTKKLNNNKPKSNNKRNKSKHNA